jgi:tetratricopeptide (TPR) repeat protein
MHYKLISLSFLLLFASLSLAIGQETEHSKLFFRNGEAFRNQKKYILAIKEYDQAIAADSKQPDFYFAKGMCHFLLNEPIDGVNAMEKVIAIKPDYEAAYGSLIKGYEMIGNTDKVVATISKMASVETDNTKKMGYYNQIIQTLNRQKQYAKALPHINAALSADPNDFSIKTAEAQAHNGMGNYQKTISTLEAFQPTFSKLDATAAAPIYYELGFAYYHIGDYKNANVSFEKGYQGQYKSLISKLQPSHFFNVAYGFSLIYEYETTDKMLQTVLKIDPTYAKAYDLLADIAIKQEHHHMGILYYEKAVKGLAGQDQYVEEIYVNKLIPSLINAERYIEGIRICDEALKLFPNSRSIKYLKAIAYHHLDKNKEAIAIMDLVLAEPSIPAQEEGLYHFALGMMHKASNNNEAAKNSLRSASKGSFTNASLYVYEMILEEEAIKANKIN